MAQKTKRIRVIRTWDIDVPAEYGDTDDDLMAKVGESTLDDTAPDSETRLILPDDATDVPETSLRYLDEELEGEV